MSLRQLNSAPRVLVLDDDASLRVLLRSILEDAGFDVMAAEHGDEALALAAEQAPDIAILDVQLPGLSGYEVLRRLRQRWDRKIMIMFLTGSRIEPLDRAEGLEMGADDYLLKPFDPSELVARVRALLRRAQPAPRTTANSKSLTPRELEVIELLGRGLAPAEIASELFIAPKTVSKHIERSLRKLGVHSRTQAVALAYTQGLINIDAPSTRYSQGIGQS